MLVANFPDFEKWEGVIPHSTVELAYKTAWEQIGKPAHNKAPSIYRKECIRAAEYVLDFYKTAMQLLAEQNKPSQSNEKQGSRFSVTQSGEATSDEALRVLHKAEQLGYALEVEPDRTIVATRLPGGTSSFRSNSDILRFGRFLSVVRFQDASGPSPADVRKVKDVQDCLSQEFAKHGLDFMTLHPTIHRSLLDEALVFGRIERTVEMFFETVAIIQQKPSTEDEKAQMLLDIRTSRPARIRLGPP
jgi:hypothetical protein